MNLSPSAPHRQENQALDVRDALGPVIRAMGVGRIARSTLLGFAAGAVGGAVLLAAARLHSFDRALPLALLSTAIGAVVGVAFGAMRWPRPLEAARAADRHFGLDDRLTTALELRSSDSPVATVQRRDVSRRIDGLPLSRSHGPWMRQSEVAAIGLAIVALAGTLWLSAALGPSRAPHAASKPVAAEHARRTAAAQLKHLAAQLRLGLTPQQRQTAAMRKLDLALARLRRQLLNASTQRSALRAISTTQQQLHQLALGLHPVNGKAVAQLNGSLSRYLNKAPAAKSSGASARSALATAQALNRLAQSLAHLTPSQRAALARALARAANTTSSSSLRSSLRQAASSLANSNPQSATSSLQQAAQALAQTAAQQAALARLGSAQSQLQSLKSQLSGQAGSAPQLAQAPGSIGAQLSGVQTGPGRQGAGRGTGSAPGRGTRPGTGRGIGSGQGLRGGQRANLAGRGAQQGRGRGNVARGLGAGRGRGTGNRQGTAGSRTSGSRGSGGVGRANSTRSGRTVTVYIPARQGKGQNTILTGPNGAPEPGAYVPYQQVVGQYSQSAHQALDRAALPPALQGYVRRYFSTISH